MTAGALGRAVIVVEVREGREVGARRVAAGTEIEVVRRWERRGVPVCRGTFACSEGRIEFVAPAADLEAAGVELGGRVTRATTVSGGRRAARQGAAGLWRAGL